MNKNYILLDLANTFFRARHSIQGSTEDKIGMSIHTVLSSMKKAWKEFNGTHMVVCLEGRSWRKDFYPPYKKQRSDARALQSPKEMEEDKVFWETFEEFKNFIQDKTNCTVLHHPKLEADDLIAGWIQNHPNDNHVIISTDGDFAQLIAPNVKQYNGVSGVTISVEGYIDAKGKPLIDKKTKLIKPAPDPEWLLFEKCMRGDTSDNVFSAYPGVRTKGSKNKIGLLEAYSDKKSKGYSWNNLMLQKFLHHDGTEHRVLDDYNRNVVLCDLSAQPQEIKDIIKNTIDQVKIENKNVSHVGIKFMKFCTSHELNRISEQIDSYIDPLLARYETE